MANKPHELDESTVDVFDSVKRALAREGIVRSRSKAKTSKKPLHLKEVTHLSHDIFFSAETVFPLTLFPDTVTVDREKLAFINRRFFRVAKIISIPVRDLLSVEADVGPFFGSVHIASRFFNPVPYSINFLKRKDAIKLANLLQGSVIALEQSVDISGLTKKQIIELLTDLGKGHDRK